MSDLTKDTKATILLYGRFEKDRSEKPLSLREYSQLVHWLIKMKKRPGDLLKKENITEASKGSGIEEQRLESLLGRGVQLGFAVEEWQRNGIWIISRSDADYPVRYKKHLKEKAPPILFGVGDRSLLSGGGLGIVGSRNVDQKGETFTRQVAELCACNQMPVVSGGARGVDRISMNAVLEAGGNTIGILAENLLKKSVERSARQAIDEGHLLLISPYHPNARFTVGSAMGRNKLIYAMSDYGLIVHAEFKKGGTWAGAYEELNRENPRPVFVRVGSVPQGNSELLKCLGAIPWPESITNRSNFKQQLDLAAKEAKNRHNSESSCQETELFEKPTLRDTKDKIQAYPSRIYQAALPIILDKLDSPATGKELAKTLNIKEGQLNVWLKKAVAENKITKLSKPVRYRKAGPEKQGQFFKTQYRNKKDEAGFSK